MSMSKIRVLIEAKASKRDEVGIEIRSAFCGAAALAQGNCGAMGYPGLCTLYARLQAPGSFSLIHLSFALPCTLVIVHLKTHSTSSAYSFSLGFQF